MTVEQAAARLSRSGGLVDQAQYRAWCRDCRRPQVNCYCALIEPFHSEPSFVILTQPREAKHSFGTGRMAHRCLSNSLLLEGVDFSADERVNRELANPANFPVLLYPSRDSVNLSRRTSAEHFTFVPARRNLLVFVLDGTWKSARKMIRLSRNLANLPRISFEPPAPSSYRIRRQPKPHCYSTIEAIHHVIQLLTPCSGERRSHDNLLTVFDSVIEQQLTYSP
ncbi:MAG: tRNA-uridine aminocarboxypropyltransferase [Candidatus Binatia bacterium]